MAGEDVQLVYATEWLDGQQGSNATAVSLPTATASQTQKAGLLPVSAFVALGIAGIGAVMLRRK
jgi:hypothetical protein